MKLNFRKSNGLIPVIIQDGNSRVVLMLGYMNREAYEKSVNEKQVTFYSRSKKRLWTKGETSGNYLEIREILPDCDGDALLIKVIPKGPVCHTGQDSCFSEINEPADNFLFTLEKTITNRKKNPKSGSYTTGLFSEGRNRIAQKVGEEATELIIAAMEENNDNFKNEAADLIYHLLVLLKEKNVSLSEVVAVLENRHQIGNRSYK
jgi:phosphoribosyl-ATP pyrophosphohydrolase/phosphoribosyl-AMP cyclohydrolase